MLRMVITGHHVALTVDGRVHADTKELFSNNASDLPCMRWKILPKISRARPTRPNDWLRAYTAFSTWGFTARS